MIFASQKSQVCFLPLGLGVLDLLFFLSVWSSRVELFRVHGYTVNQTELVDRLKQDKAVSSSSFQWHLWSFYLALLVALSQNVWSL